jgi:hypothetical protein
MFAARVASGDWANGPTMMAFRQAGRWRLEGGPAVSTHATTPFSPSRSARSRGERLRPAAVFEP